LAVQPCGKLIPRRLLLVSTYAAGIGMLLYGALGSMVDTLRLVGVFGVPSSAWIAVRWHVSLWAAM
jgi:lipoprotein signal peptidase